MHPLSVYKEVQEEQPASAATLAAKSALFLVPRQHRPLLGFWVMQEGTHSQAVGTSVLWWWGCLDSSLRRWPLHFKGVNLPHLFYVCLNVHKQRPTASLYAQLPSQPVCVVHSTTGWETPMGQECRSSHLGMRLGSPRPGSGICQGISCCLVGWWALPMSQGPPWGLGGDSARGGTMLSCERCGHGLGNQSTPATL